MVLNRRCADARRHSAYGIIASDANLAASRACQFQDAVAKLLQLLSQKGLRANGYSNRDQRRYTVLGTLAGFRTLWRFSPEASRSSRAA